MSFTRKTAGRKTTKQLDGMDAEQLRTLASTISRRIRERKGHLDESTKWKKRLHHINRVKDERTVRIKPGDNHMQNLIKRLVKTKVPSRTNKDTGSTAAGTGSTAGGPHQHQS